MTDYRLHTILLHTHNQLGNRSTADDFIGDFNVITEKKKKYVSWIILKIFDFFYLLNSSEVWKLGTGRSFDNYSLIFERRITFDQKDLFRPRLKLGNNAVVERFTPLQICKGKIYARGFEIYLRICCASQTYSGFVEHLSDHTLINVLQIQAEGGLISLYLGLACFHCNKRTLYSNLNMATPCFNTQRGQSISKSSQFFVKLVLMISRNWYTMSKFRKYFPGVEN